MKTVAQIKSILLAVATVATLVSSTPRTVVVSHSAPSKTIQVDCGKRANLILELAATGEAKIGVEKSLEGHSQFKMMNAETLNWFESNGSIWINDQIQIDVQTGQVSIHANVLPTDFSVDHNLCKRVRL